MVSERPNTKIILPEPHVIDEEEEEAEVRPANSITQHNI